MGLIDLSMTIQPMWRWPIEIGLVKDIRKGDPYQVTTVKTGMHSFTHVDTPLHIEPGRESIDQVDLERLCGPAAVVDLSPVDAEPGDRPGVARRASRTCATRGHRASEDLLGPLPGLHHPGVLVRRSLSQP